MVHGFLYLARAASLADSLRDLDSRGLADIGLVRAEDGTLRLASDPAVLATPDQPTVKARSLGDSLRALAHLKWSPLR